MIRTASYRRWRKRRKPTGPAPKLLPMGVYGVGYRPSHFTDKVFDVATMQQLTPHNDDLWFAATRRKDVPAKIVACRRGVDLKPAGPRLSRRNLRGRNDQEIARVEKALGWPNGHK